MEKELQVTLTKCRKGQPLVVVHNLPGEGAEMRPEVMRALAVALYRAAMDCDDKHKRLWGVLPAKRSYSVEATA